MFTAFCNCLPWIRKSSSPPILNSSEYRTQTQLDDELTPMIFKDSEAHTMQKKREKVRFAIQKSSREDKAITKSADSSEISPNYLVKMDEKPLQYRLFHKASGQCSSQQKKTRRQDERDDHQKPQKSFLLYVRDFAFSDSNLRRRAAAGAWRKRLLIAGNSSPTGRKEILVKDNPLFVSTQIKEV